MNPEELLNVAAEAMRKCKNRERFFYSLCIYDGELLCVPSARMLKDARLVCEITRKELEGGLTSVGWANIQTRLARIFKELTL